MFQTFLKMEKRNKIGTRRAPNKSSSLRRQVEVVEHYAIAVSR
jgi:hypothetical protein